jgi:tRNA threonylcarbamoyladenosine biosynthesis protein TsaB
MDSEGANYRRGGSGKIRLMSSMRRILAIDSSTELVSVCFTDGERWIERREDAGQRHSALIMALIRSTLDEAHCAVSDLDEVAFGAGPGSFTGLRIACGIAQGIGYGARVPVRAVSSLMAVAQSSGCEAVIAAIDARMNEVYWAAYRRRVPDSSDHRELADNAQLRGQRPRWSEIVEPTVSPAADVTLPPDSDPVDSDAAADIGKRITWCAAGNAFARFAALVAMLPPSTRIESSVAVTARAIAELALAGHGALDDAEHAMPVYIRDKVAMTAAERRAARP